MALSFEELSFKEIKEKERQELQKNLVIVIIIKLLELRRL